MNKLENSQIERENITQPTIAVNTDLIKEIQKLFKENWNVALTKIEQQILKILYYENSALNVYEIRRHLIFSTIYEITKQIKELHQTKEKEEFKKLFSSKSPYHTSKQHQEMVDNTISELSLVKYEKYPYFEFTPSQSANFYFQMNRYIRFYQAYNTFKPTPEQQEVFYKQIDREKPYVRYPETSFSVPYIISNKTKAEELFYLVLREMKIEIYGFKTISDALNNLISMKAVLTRELKKGKSKKVFFLNPLIITHIQTEDKKN